MKDLSTETQSLNDLQTPPLLTEHSNFRLARGCEVVVRVFEAHTHTKEGDCTPTLFVEIDSSDRSN